MRCLIVSLNLKVCRLGSSPLTRIRPRLCKATATTTLLRIRHNSEGPDPAGLDQGDIRCNTLSVFDNRDKASRQTNTIENSLHTATLKGRHLLETRIVGQPFGIDNLKYFDIIFRQIRGSIQGKDLNPGCRLFFISTNLEKVVKTHIDSDR